MTELATALPASSWTLAGGLMTQLHAIHHGAGVVRPTNDTDVVLHIETGRGVPNTVADVLERLGYRLAQGFDPRTGTARRFVRGRATVGLVGEDQADVMIADHAAPRVVERLRGHDMIRMLGGTQALRRTVNARLHIGAGAAVAISVPGPFGALILKAAACVADSRDPQRHLFDAAALLACVDDLFVERAGIGGSDRSRLAVLARPLHADHPAWRALSDHHRTQAQLALSLLTEPT